MSATRRGRAGWRGVRPLRLLRRTWLRALRHHATPHQTALGFAIGAFIGVSPAWGLHLWLSLLCCALLPVNRVALLLANVATSNPWSFLPVVAADLWIGQFVVAWTDGASPDAWAALARIRGASDLWANLGVIGKPFVYGGMVLGFLLAGAAYAVAYPVAASTRARRTARRRLRASRASALPSVAAALALVAAVGGAAPVRAETGPEDLTSPISIRARPPAATSSATPAATALAAGVAPAHIPTGMPQSVTRTAEGGWSPYTEFRKGVDWLVPRRTQKLAREFEISLFTSAPYSVFWSAVAMTVYLTYQKRFNYDWYHRTHMVENVVDDARNSRWSVGFSNGDRWNMAFIAASLSLTVAVRHTHRMHRALPSEEEAPDLYAIPTPGPAEPSAPIIGIPQVPGGPLPGATPGAKAAPTAGPAMQPDDAARPQ